MSFDPVIRRSKALTMLQLQHSVAAGYGYAISGVVAASRAMALAAKFDSRYSVSANKNLRYKRKVAGQENALLYLYPQQESTSLLWWLLRTSPDPGERFIEVKGREHLRWEREYELVRLTVPRELKVAYARHGRTSNAVTWTWRVTYEQREAWRARIKHAAAQLPYTETPWKQMVWSLDRVPGFRGCRNDVMVLRRYARLAHLRQCGCPYEWKGLPRPIRPRACEDYPLSVIASRLGKESSWWP